MATDQQVAGTTREREPVGEAVAGRYVVFTIVSLALLMASVDQTIVATALPSLQHDLHAQVNWSSWTLTIYALGQILVMPLAGKLGDQYGRKKIFLGAAVLFTTASLCCGFAGNICTGATTSVPLSGGLGTSAGQSAACQPSSVQTIRLSRRLLGLSGSSYTRSRTFHSDTSASWRAAIAL